MDATESQLVTPAPKRRWFQYSLRTLMLFMVCCSIACSWMAVKMQCARQQSNAVEALRKVTQCTFYYDRRGLITNATNPRQLLWNCDLHGCPWDLDMSIAKPGPGLWEVWARGLFGDHFVRHIVTVELPPNRIDEAIAPLKQLPYLRTILVATIVDGHNDKQQDADANVAIEKLKREIADVDVMQLQFDCDIDVNFVQPGPQTAGLWISDSVRICWTDETTEAVANAASWLGLLIAL